MSTKQKKVHENDFKGEDMVEKSLFYTQPTHLSEVCTFSIYKKIAICDKNVAATKM